MKDYYHLFTKQDILLAKLQEIYLEYYSIKKEYNDSKDIFLQTGEEKVENKEEKNEEKEEKGEEKSEEKKERGLNESVLFRKLVLLTHPDKNKISSGHVLYDQVKKAQEQGKFAKLCFLAKFLTIPIGDLSEVEQGEIKATIEKKKEKIRHYSRTYPVLYGREKSEDAKKRLIDTFKRLNK